MKGGTKLHKQLEEEVYTTVKIDIAKKEDAFGLKLWNIIQGLRTLRDTGMTRELEIWGVVDGNIVNGVIDGLTHENPDPDFEEEIRSSQGSQNSQPAQDQQKITSFFGSRQEKSPQVYLFDVKTRGSNTLPSGAAVRPTKIQLYLYHRLLANMAAGKLDFPHVFSRYGLNLDEPFSDSFVAQIGTLHDEIFDDAVSSAPSKKSSSDYASAPSTPPGGFGLDLTSAPPPDLIHYRTLRALLPLLQSELQLTFPRGADSLGSLVTVEYRRRARPPTEADASGMNSDENEREDDAGEIIGHNVFYVDDGVLDQYLTKDMEWWRGLREPRGVVIEEAYKCRSCEFADSCDWRRDQEAELLRLARVRRGKRKA
jgi:exonuclease V